MATTYTYTKGCGYNDHYTLTIKVTINSQNIANNTTNVTVSMSAVSDSNSYGAYDLTDSSPVKLIVNGTTVFNKNISIDLRNKKTASLASWTGNITHDTNGTKTLACSGSFYVSGSSYMGSSYATTLTTSTTLTTIARQSSISSMSSSTNTIGETFTLKLSVQNSTFSHRATIKIGSTTIVSSTNIASGNTSATFSTSDTISTWAKAMPNATSSTATVYVDTYSGSTKIGSTVSKTFTVNLPSSVVPSISSISVTDTAIASGTSTYLEIYGGYVQLYSKPSVSVSAAGNNGSTIKTYAVTLNNKSYNSTSSPVTCSTLNESGTLNVSVTVTDSRNRKATKSTTITVLPYAAPTITNFSVFRCNTDGTKNDGGAYLNATCTYTASPLLNGSTIQNTGTLQCICTPTSGGSSLTKSLNITGSNSAQSASIIITSTNTETSYDVYLKLSDKLSTVKTSNYNVGTTYVLLHLSDNGDGFAIGKACELEDTFDVALTTIIRKTVEIMSNLTVHGEISEI